MLNKDGRVNVSIHKQRNGVTKENFANLLQNPQCVYVCITHECSQQTIFHPSNAKCIDITHCRTKCALARERIEKESKSQSVIRTNLFVSFQFQCTIVVVATATETLA